MNSAQSIELIRLGATEVELIANAHFLGMGAVHQGSDLLRDGTRPMFVEIRNPSAIELLNYRMVDREVGPDEARLVFEAERQQSGTMEWMLHTVRNRYATTDWTEPAVHAEGTRLELVLRSVEREIGGERFAGFSYQYLYRSENVPIYKILDRGTWEPSGGIVGSEFWLRNGIVPSIMPFTSIDQRYSTEWHLPSIEQPNIFQFFPLQMAMQGFTFTSSPGGTLVTWPTRPAHVRSLFEKHAGKSALFHWHEHCGDLANEFETAPMEVLWLSDPSRDRVRLLNRFEAVRALIWDQLHALAGLREERIEPYGVLEEWELPDMAMYRDVAAPALMKAGAKTIFLPNEFQNNMNVYGVGNMCCNVDFKLPDTIDQGAFREMCAYVRREGGKVEMWGNTALSSLTEILSRKNGPKGRVDFLPYEGSVMEALRGARHPWVRNASGAIEADHYTPVFCALNLREPKVMDYWMQSWKALQDDFGVEQIFVDSSFNMSADKFTHRQNDRPTRAGGATIDQVELLGATRPESEPPQAIESQYLAYLELLRKMQEIGYTVCGEDVGLFGLSRSGPDMEERLPSLPLWVDSYCDFSADVARRAGMEPDDAFFRGLAFRVMWKLYFHISSREVTFRISGAKSDADRPSAWHTRLLAAYSEVLPAMRSHRVLPNEAGVRYESEGETVLWAFGEGHLDFDGPREAVELLSGKRQTVARLGFGPRELYRTTRPAG